MFARKLLWGVPVLGAAGVGLWIDGLNAAAAEKQEVKPAVTLPVTRVVLFNSGVGYFTRGGEVEGEARVDLIFPEDDVNDLLKSMVLEAFNGGRPAGARGTDRSDRVADCAEPTGQTRGHGRRCGSAEGRLRERGHGSGGVEHVVRRGPSLGETL